MKQIFLTLNILFCVFFVTDFGCSSGLSLPRFASMRASKVNLHVGPGVNFHVTWMYTLQFMPVEIIAEFDTWRQIRDFQGTEGWVHKSLLSGKRHFIVMHQTQAVVDRPDHKGKPVAFLEANVIGKLKECQGHWCRIEVTDDQTNGKSKTFKGWIPRQSIWGTYLHETKM
jgi:SH3-like domain-containing protein